MKHTLVRIATLLPRVLWWILRRVIWGTLKRAVRILLWLNPFTWPIGLWRSLVHGRNKQTRKLKKHISAVAK